MTRNDIVFIEQSLDSFTELSLELSDIFESIQKFYNMCIENSNEEKGVLRLLTARRYLESCITIIKNVIEPTENFFIEKINNKFPYYIAFETHINNLMSILDIEQKNLDDNIKDSKKTIDRHLIVSSHIVMVTMKRYRETLIDYMQNLIINPLKNTCNIYAYTKKESEKSPREIFAYLLFRELFISAQIKGSDIRHKIKASKGSDSITFHETNFNKTGRNKSLNENQNVNQNVNQSPPEIDDFEELFLENESN